DIATEKLAVLEEGSVLALGAQPQPEVLALARAVAAERGAQLLVAGEAREDLQMRVHGSFQRQNFALARLAAESYLKRRGLALDEQAVREAAASTRVPGRMQVVSSDPLTVVDGAHNPAAIAALVESLPRLLEERSLALVLGVLEDKDATSMLRVLLPLCERAWFTAPPSQRALSPATLQSLAGQLGFEHSTCEPQPARALAAARNWARAREGGGAVLATGSVYLVGDLLARPREHGLDPGMAGIGASFERSQSIRGSGSA
ncbi:MAG TPA: cyanophycin synthetase, partial [Solirubrobacteraceae bacterium]|nr:cyanophycin synthetase [Solirubrobacteraceae bacterium]